VVSFACTLATGLIGFLAGSELLVRHAMRSDAYEIYRERFRAVSTPRIAIGDSRTAAAIHGHDLDNLGLPGDDLQVVIGKLKARHALKPLSHVILQADPHQFAAYRLLKDGTGKVDDQIGDQPLLASMRPYYRQYLMAYWNAALLKFVGKNEPIKPAEPPPAPDQAGFAWRELAVSRVQFHLPLDRPEITQVATTYRRIVADLAADGVKLCLVTYPVSSYYRQAARRYPSFDRAIAFYDKVATEVGVARVNLWAAIDDGDFGDTDHIRQASGPAFTATLLDRCFGGT
jgi:hypothetical protein